VLCLFNLVPALNSLTKYSTFYLGALKFLPVLNSCTSGQIGRATRMPRQRQTQTRTHNHSAPVFVCPVDPCPGKTRVLTGIRAWTRHRRANHPDVDFSQYGNVMRTDIPASGAPNPSVISSPSSSLASILEDDPFTMEDYTVGDLPPDDLLLSDPPNYHTEQSQSDLDTDGDSQSDGSIKIHYHPILNGIYLVLHLYTAVLRTNTNANSGKPCDSAGDFLIDPTSPPPPTINAADSSDWAPFRDEIAFSTAEYFFKEDQTSAGKIDRLLELWAATLVQHGDTPPFSDHQDLYNIIDSISVGDVPWESHTFTYEGERPEQDPPKWMTTEYTIWYRDPRQLFRNMLGNPEFAEYMDYAPLRQFGPSEDGDEFVREYENFMSGDWAWKQAVRPCILSYGFHHDSSVEKDILAGSPDNHGATFAPIILGSDKTTVSVGTGHNEYWPLYGSIGNIHNNIRRAHGSGLVLVGFLAIPHGMFLVVITVINKA
jgi:hypothetical protein